MKSKRLEWDEIAEYYTEKTGLPAKLKPMEHILQWFERQPGVRKYSDGSFGFRK